MVNSRISQLLGLAPGSEHGIKETRYLGREGQPAGGGYPIAFGVDGNFIRHACIAIQSLIAQAGSAQLRFHLITSEDTAGVADKLQALVAGTDHGIHTHQLPAALFANLPATALFTKAIYYRLLAPYLLEQQETLLYLDADIVCINSFITIYQQLAATPEVACVVSEDAPLAASLAGNIGLRGTRYFNSGMLLIDVQRWLQAAISEKVLAVLEERGDHFQYMDQDALNIVLEGKVKFIDRKYNTIFMLEHNEKGYAKMPANNTVFLHYAGADKPWQQWNKQRGCRFYTDIYQTSPWAAWPFDLPRHDQQAKKMYKRLFREKKYLSGLRWYIRYFILRYGK